MSRAKPVVEILNDINEFFIQSNNASNFIVWMRVNLHEQARKLRSLPSS